MVDSSRFHKHKAAHRRNPDRPPILEVCGRSGLPQTCLRSAHPEAGGEGRFAAANGGLARRGPKGCKPRRPWAGVAPGKAKKVILGWCVAAGSQSLLMSKETFSSLRNVWMVKYGPISL